MGTLAPVPRICGRETEIQALGEALDQVAAGGPAIMLVEGEAGIGKTRLLAKALKDAAGRGMRVAAGRAEELERTRPFGVLAATLGCARSSPDAYRDRERVFAGVMADRADWDAATRAQRHLAVAADAELRRRHPGQRFTPLRSAEPQAATDAQRAELSLAAGQDVPEAGQWIKDLAAGRRGFAARLADRQNLMIPAEDPGYGDLGQAFPAWIGSSGDAILQPPKPEIRPSARVLERIADRDADIEAGE